MVPRSWGVKETRPFVVTTALARHANPCLSVLLSSSEETELLNTGLLRGTAVD